VNTLTRRGLVAASATLPLLAAGRARAQAPTLRIGVLTDMSGTYRDASGPLAVMAAQQAVQDFGAATKGLAVEVLSADHQNKPDVGAGVARQWFDSGVDIILEVTNSAVGLAVAGVARDKNKAYSNSGAATSDLTGPQCNANTIHWSYDTYMLAKSTGGALVKAGGDSWFFMTADYAFGNALQRDTTAFIQAAGGKVVGSVKYPFPSTTDFSSFLVQAQSSGAKILGLASAGADTVNQVKQAREFGVTSSMKLAALLCFISDVHSIGLEIGQGLRLTNSFYWDMNDRTRAFSERLRPKMPAARPGMIHAGVYASALHFLKVAAEMGAAKAKESGAATVARMKAMPTDDDCFGKGVIRSDGLAIHPSFLWEVKTPGESKHDWDLLKPVATTPADEAFRPLAEGGCTLPRT